MKFDPTNDYYGMDISQETNRAIWDFWEFIKNLVTLSSPANIQREIIGYGSVIDEMVMDFDSYYTLNYESYLNKKLITQEQVSKLNILDKFLEDRSIAKTPDFWKDDLLETNSDWKKVREMAKEILKSMRYDDLVIELERSSQQSNSNEGKPLIIEGTKIRLKRKTSANNV